MLYVHDREYVVAALEHGDAAFILDTRTGMAMPLDSSQTVGEPIKESLAEVYDAVCGRKMWTWFRNTRCKYVRLISTAGSLYLLDRDGHPITFAQLTLQVK